MTKERLYPKPKEATRYYCSYCGGHPDGPMLVMGDGYGHAECVLRKVAELLDPDWEPDCGREPLPVTWPLATPCACRGRETLFEEQSKVSGGWLLTSIQLDVNLGVDRDVDVLVFANEPQEGER